jgi:hypothetical protein
MEELLDSDVEWQVEDYAWEPRMLQLGRSGG